MFLAGGFKKVVAMVIMAVFFGVIGVSAYPLPAQEQAAHPEQPGAVEKIGKAGAPSSGGSILPILLIGVGVLAVAAVLVFVVFKTTYDITGTWTFIMSLGGQATQPLAFTFTGTKDSGTWVESSASGTYTVSGKNVTFLINSPPAAAYTFAGQFTDKNTMTGTYVVAQYNFTWTATRTSATAAMPTPQAGQTAPFFK